jgi:hypothetical protein
MKSHRTDVVSLVFGLIFLLVAGWWAAVHYFDLHWDYTWDVPNLGWIVAAGLILLGLLGILSTLRRDPPATDAPTGPDALTDPGSPREE